MNLLSEFRRRNVFRMALLYVVAAWLVVQVAESIFQGLGIPESSIRYVWIAAAVGLPIALVLSWFYEVTPEGVSLERSGEAGDSITRTTGRRVDFIIIAMLCAAVILFAYDKWWTGPPPERSVAVLPFT